jgi:hypothetical protein
VTRRVIRSMRGAVGLALGLITFGGSARAGDYGLTVDDSVKSGCSRDLKHTRNECRSDVVLDDLRAHHLEGKPLQIAAVEVGLHHCSVWFTDAGERAAFYRGLVDIAKESQVVDEGGLLHAMGCFPFKSMRQALEAVTALGGESEKGLRRVRKAHAQLMKFYRE